jgi:gluconolactonase
MNLEQDHLIDSVGLHIKKLADLLFYTEGPVADSAGDYFCTTLTAGIILKVNGEGKVFEWARCPSPNGQIILSDDIHLVCDSVNGIMRFDSNGRWIKNDAGKTCAGEQVFSPNDLCCDKAGNIYYTDSVRNTGKVCYKGSDGEERILASGLDFPNGIVISKDEKTLFVAESYKNRILGIALDDNNKTEVFSDLPKNPSGGEIGNLPDGLEIDEEGMIWVAHYGMGAIQVLSSDGVLKKTIKTGLPLTSNLSFIDQHSLLFTGGYKEPGPGGLFKISM